MTHDRFEAPIDTLEREQAVARDEPSLELHRQHTTPVDTCRNCDGEMTALQIAIAGGHPVCVDCRANRDVPTETPTIDPTPQESEP